MVLYTSARIKANRLPTHKTAVIIPYYQEQAGILRRAMTSVFGQSGPVNLDIIVVDDGSLVPAREELRGLEVPPDMSLRILEQVNAGPGAARNKGLDNVGADIRYVAFLDSDDEWHPDHLATAIRALEKNGYDLYFCNLRRFDQDLSYFDLRNTDLGRHERKDLEDDLYEFSGDLFDDIIFYRVPRTTLSSVVYRQATLSGIRFPEQFFIGEDRAFFLRAALLTSKVVFSSKIHCLRGKGVNIYDGSEWGTDRQLWRVRQSIKLQKWLEKNFPLTDAQRRRNGADIRAQRENFISGAIHCLRHRKNGIHRQILKTIYEDPSILYLAVPIAARILLNKYKTRSATSNEHEP